MEQLPKIVGQRLQAVSSGVHPDANLLAGFAEKSLLPREQTQVLDHLAGCAACREVVAHAQPEEVPQRAAAAAPGSARRLWFQGSAARWAALAACVVVVGAVVIARSHFLQPKPVSVATYSAPPEMAKVEVAKNAEQPAPSSPSAQVLEDKESEKKMVISKTAPVVGTRRDEVSEFDRLRSAGPLPRVSEGRQKLDADKGVLQAKNDANMPAEEALKVSRAAAAPASSPVADDAKGNKREFSADKAMKVPMATNETVQVEAVTTVPPAAAKAAPDSGRIAGQQATPNQAELRGFYKSKDGYVGTAGVTGGSLGSAGRFPTPRWQLSAEGTLLKSSDLGRSWQPVPLGDKEVFRALCVTDREVWVGGAKGSLFYSANAGEAWEQVKPTANGHTLAGDITAIDFKDPQHGKLTTSDHQTWITSDGGHVWQVETR